MRGGGGVEQEWGVGYKGPIQTTITIRSCLWLGVWLRLVRVRHRNGRGVRGGGKAKCRVRVGMAWVRVRVTVKQGGGYSI